MNLGLLLVLLLHAADPAPLSAAREAFARGAYDESASLAAEQARPPIEGEALYLAGLAWFRAGRTAEALDALDRAGATADPPPRGAWQFNRAACLYELGRFPEAEEAFVAAADGAPALAALALANAGFAALDGGALARATALAGRARALGDAAAMPIVDDLEARITRDRGHELVAAASAALAGGDRVEARRMARSATALPLDGTDAVRARAIVDATSPGMRARGTGWELWLRGGAGWDSNVLQSGVRGTQDYVPVVTGQVESAALLGSAGVGHRARWGEHVTVEAAYAFEQLAYLASAAEDYSLQLHSIGAAGEWAPTDSLRVGLGALGAWTFTGLSSFRTLQASAGVQGWAALDETDATTTRVDAGWTWKQGAESEFSYLTGDRLDVGLTQQLRIRSASLELGYRYRDERIGTLTTQGAATLGIPGCAMVSCLVEYTEPFSYRSHAVLLAGRTPLGDALQVGALAGFEWRTYAGENVLTATITAGMMGGGTVEVFRQHREDQRFLGVLFASWRAKSWLSLQARYDLVVNTSSIQETWDDRNYTKQVVTLEAAFTW